MEEQQLSLSGHFRLEFENSRTRQESRDTEALTHTAWVKREAAVPDREGENDRSRESQDIPDKAPTAFLKGHEYSIYAESFNNLYKYDLSNVPELDTASSGSEVTSESVNHFDGRSSNQNHDPQTPSSGTSLPESTLVAAATTLADHWLADSGLWSAQRLPFLIERSGQSGAFGTVTRVVVPTPLAYGSDGTGGSWSQGADAGQNHGVTSQSRGVKRRHRNDDRDGEDNGEGEGADGSGWPLSGRRKQQRIVRVLACPYYKRNPSRYSANNTEEMEYRGCAGRFLPDISRLKQHLHRVHRRPKAYCGRCYVTFANQAQLDQHLQSAQRCSLSAPQYQERMTDEQATELRKKSPNNSTEENWFAIWSILFPGDPPPASPYLDDIKDGLHDFLQFFRREAPPILQASYEALHITPPSFIPVNDITLMLDTAISRILSHWTDNRNAPRALQTGFQHPSLPDPLPVTSNDAMTRFIREDAIKPHFVNPGISVAPPVPENSTIGVSYFVSPPPLNPFDEPRIVDTSNEDLTEDPYYNPADAGSMNFTKASPISLPLEWDWDEILNVHE